MLTDLSDLNAYAAKEAAKLHEWAKGYLFGLGMGYFLGLLTIWAIAERLV